MTVRAMAVGDGSAGTVTAQPVGVNTHTRAREAQRSVTARDQIHQRRVSPMRRVGRVMYLDAADSWIVREHSPAPATVWATDYTAHIPGAYRPFVLWCRAYRIPAVLVGAVLDGIKFLLIHPARGPVTVSVGFLLYLYATH